MVLHVRKGHQVNNVTKKCKNTVRYDKYDNMYKLTGL